MTSAGITVNFPKWVLWVNDISSWVTNTGLQYRDKRYAHCLYSIMIHNMGGMGYAVSAYFACSPGRPTGLGPNTPICKNKEKWQCFLNRYKILQKKISQLAHFLYSIYKVKKELNVLFSIYISLYIY